MAPVVERRDNCPAYAHDTSGAFVHHGCQCFAARAARHYINLKSKAKQRGKTLLPPNRGPHQTPEHVVRCLVAGLDPGCPSTRDERWEAIRRLALTGMPAVRIADRIGLSTWTIQRRLQTLTVSEWMARQNAIERQRAG